MSSPSAPVVAFPPVPLVVTAMLAVVSPTWVAVTLSPSATLLNQLLACSGWGALLMALAGVPGVSWPIRRALRTVAWPLAALAGMAVGVLASWAQALPRSLALPALVLLAMAALVLLVSQVEHQPSRGTDPNGPLWQPVLCALLLAGVAGSLIGVVQVFAPQWADGLWIARSGLVGRAVGNLRQPNHLSTLLLWALIALVPLASSGRWLGRRLPPVVALLLVVWLTLGVVLTASRTGLLGVLMLAVWGALDRGLPRRVRWALLATPLLYGLFWLLVTGWAHQTQHTFGGEERMSLGGDVSSSRFGIWGNTLSLILAHPWAGVGFGQFNFAWTLTPFPGRPGAFFDHSHNLLLQFAVELGLPAALLLTVLLLGAVWQGWQRSRQGGNPEPGSARAAWMMVLLVGVHSLLEYPLWYSYFLLPTAWAMGQMLRPGAASSSTEVAGDDEAPPAPGPGMLWMALLGAAMVVGALLALRSYQQVAAIYEPGEHNTLSLAERIRIGHGSWLFAHHADYAAATVNDPPELRDAGLATTAYSLLDTRLMITWANALAEQGRLDEARYLARRLWEFRNAAANEFFAPCKEAPASEQLPLPFQCQPDPEGLNWQSFQQLLQAPS